MNTRINGFIRIQFASDLHLERGKINIGESSPLPFDHQSGEVLCLCGDIGHPEHPAYRALLERCSQLYQAVYVVAGNHEFYGGEVYSTRETIAQMCSSIARVHFLDGGNSHLYIVRDEQSGAEIGRVRFCGATLWSYVPEEASLQVRLALNDYRMIQLEDKRAMQRRLLSVNDTNSFHEQEKAKLEEEIERARQAGEHVVVVVHHAPLSRGTSAPQYETDPPRPTNHAFATNLEYSSLFGRNVSAVLFGHTHHSSRQVVRGTVVASNQLGYEFESHGTGYQPNATVDVPYGHYVEHE